MKLFLTSIILIVFTTVQAQENYNLKKGFIAEGYDVVAYFENIAVKGSDQFTTEFKGAKYKFSSFKNLKTFKENPDMFVPQYGGFCAYAIAVKGEKIGINPKSFQIIDNKLYLFYNKWGVDTLEKWNQENTEILQIQADTNWKKITN